MSRLLNVVAGRACVDGPGEIGYRYRAGPSDSLLGFDCGGQQWVLETAFPTGTLQCPHPPLFPATSQPSSIYSPHTHLNHHHCRHHRLHCGDRRSITMS